MSDHLILRVVAKLFIPFILLFALYVQFHGDFGPGGGFQAGVIFAAAFSLHCLVFGIDRTRRAFPPNLVEFCAAFGMLLYIGTGAAGILLGGSFLDYNVLGSDPVKGQHLGILLVELGGGITVAAVMVALFFCFCGRSPEGKDREQ